VLRVVWTNKGLDDLDMITDYIGDRNFPAAERIRALIEDASERLSNHPYVHRPGRLPGTREAVVHPNYIIVYSVDTDQVTILAVIHARQQYP